MNGTDKAACGISTCEVVNLDWLLESVEAKKPLPVKSYLFTTDLSSPAAQANGGAKADKKEDKEVKKGKGKKRTHEDAMGTNGRANGDEDESKKMKDSQKASSKKLVVPLDEGCTLGGELGGACLLDDADGDRLLCLYRWFRSDLGCDSEPDQCRP